MVIEIIGIVIACISIIVCVTICITVKKKTEKINTEIADRNEDLLIKNTELKLLNKSYQTQHDNLARNLTDIELTIDKNKKELQQLKIDKDKQEYSLELLQQQENSARDRIVKINAAAASSVEESKKLSATAFESYCDNLEKKYNETEKEYDNLKKILTNAYDEMRAGLNDEIKTIRKELDELRKSRAAAVEAARRDQLVKEDLSSYCLQISEADKSDIKQLNNLKSTLNKPRILSMLIWSTYWQKQLKTLSNNLLGTEDVTGIYKITNIVTDECYIGQAASIQDRWVQHAKCGCGIDAPAGNKLYKAMEQYGLWSFSWQLIEKCERSQLNEREKYYIEMYNSYEFGYNSTAGNK